MTADFIIPDDARNASSPKIVRKVSVLRASDFDTGSSEQGFSEPLKRGFSSALTPLDFIKTAQLDSAIHASFKERCDATVAVQPISQMPFVSTAQPAPPDITKGLGRSQRNQDLVSLCNFVQRVLKFSVYAGQLYWYKPPCWHSLTNAEADALILDLLSKNDLAYCISDADVGKIRKRLCITKQLCRPREFTPPELCINFIDGTLNVENGISYPHTSRDDFTSFVNVQYSDVCQSNEGSVFEGFVETLSDGNPLVRRQLLELIGIVLTNMEPKHFYVLVGESHTGKTQFGRFLAELLGRENVGTVRDIHSFAKTFTASVCEGKRLVSCMDLPDAPLPKDAISIMKQLVGDDAVTIEAKYQNARTLYRKPILLFASNHRISVPKVEEEQAFLNRMVIIPFANPCSPDRMTAHLYQELLQEAPYIIAQSIEALRELLSRNRRPTQVVVPEKYLPVEGVNATRIVRDYFAEAYEFADGFKIATAEMYDHFLNVSTTGLSLIDFSRALSRVIAEQAPNYVCEDKHINGKRGYRGIRLLSPDELNRIS